MLSSVPEYTVEENAKAIDTHMDGAERGSAELRIVRQASYLRRQSGVLIWLRGPLFALLFVTIASCSEFAARAALPNTALTETQQFSAKARLGAVLRLAQQTTNFATSLDVDSIDRNQAEASVVRIRSNR